MLSCIKIYTLVSDLGDRGYLSLYNILGISNSRAWGSTLESITLLGLLACKGAGSDRHNDSAVCIVSGKGQMAKAQPPHRVLNCPKMNLTKASQVLPYEFNTA